MKRLAFLTLAALIEALGIDMLELGDAVKRREVRRYARARRREARLR